LDNSRNGIIWPNAIHGNIITWNCLEAMKKRREEKRRKENTRLNKHPLQSYSAIKV